MEGTSDFRMQMTAWFFRTVSRRSVFHSLCQRHSGVRRHPITETKGGHYSWFSSGSLCSYPIGWIKTKVRYVTLHVL